MTIAAPLAVGVIIVVIWEIACRALHVPPFLFPKPSDIAAKLMSDWPALLGALGMTLRVALQAFFAAIVIGTFIAFLFVQSRAIEMSFFPYAVLLQVTPIVAIAPLIIILVKNTQIALTVCATVVALFPIISNTTLGLRSVDPGLVNLFRMNRAGRLQTLWRLRIPSALPYFFGGLRISSGLAGSARWSPNSWPAPRTQRRACLRSCKPASSWRFRACSRRSFSSRWRAWASSPSWWGCPNSRSARGTKVRSEPTHDAQARTFSSFRGAGEAREPGIHNHWRRLRIPALAAIAARPQ
jgi:NitT/TauT family transport system permease protein